MDDTPDIPRLTKMEYAESRGLSLSTVNRMIKDGRLRSELEPHGSSHRVWVYPDVPPVSPYEKLDVSGDTPDIPHVPPDGLDVPTLEAQLAAALEWVRALEELRDIYMR